jgi:hypothetical protein
MMQIQNNLQRQENNGYGSSHEEEGRHNYRRPSHSRSASRIYRDQSPPYLVRNFYASKYSMHSPKVSHVRYQRRRYELYILKGDLRNINPPSFYSERGMENDFEAYFLGIRNYFQLQNQSSNIEAKIATDHLHGKYSMWWDQLKQFEHINENMITWKWFKKIFHK